MYPYLILKHAHMGFAYLSILLFAIRGTLMLGKQTAILARRPLRILPHIIDTLLLLCAIGLLVMGGWPLGSPWLVAKMVALLVYIGLGVLALRAPSRKVRTLAFFAGLAVVFYIVLVAKSKVVLPFA
ncbi:SirB2 family protein [Neisseriaceae bacterium TC5R-5]|nr:SirB2 family protein [Neisseriaceae bacterium TC5R-5]